MILTFEAQVFQNFTQNNLTNKVPLKENLRNKCVNQSFGTVEMIVKWEQGISSCFFLQYSQLTSKKKEKKRKKPRNITLMNKERDGEDLR